MSDIHHQSLKLEPIATTSNFHAGETEMNSNFHVGRSTHPERENFHAGIVRTKEECEKGANFHAGNLHVGQINTDSNFHVGQVDKTSNFHAGNFHVGKIDTTSNFHAGKTNTMSNFHAGGVDTGSNFHAGNFHAGQTDAKSNFHAGNFHAGLNSPTAVIAQSPNVEISRAELTTKVDMNESKSQEGNFHAGNFHAGNFHAGNFHAGNFHAGNFHAGSKAKGENFHAGDISKSPDMHASQFPEKNFHAGVSKPSDEVAYDITDIINFHAGQSSNVATNGASTQTQLALQTRGIETNLNFYASTFDNNPGFNYVEKPDNGIFSNVTTSSHQLSIRDIRGSEDQLNLDRDAVLTISNIPDQGHTFADDATITRDFYPEVEQLLLSHVPGAQQVFIFDHTIRRKFGDRGPVLRAHIDQTPASALARVFRHLPSTATTLTQSRVRLINFWRPINGKVENYPLAFALSGSVPDADLEPVKHHYPTWTGETFGVRHSEGQDWCYWSGMGDGEALLLQCFDSEGGGRLVHSAVVDPSSTSNKFRESIEVRALVFG